MALYNLLLGLSVLTSFARATNTCYWPNGKAATSDWVPCPNSKVCCAVGEACLSNNLCYGSKLNIAYRGACTDVSWPIADCPRICYQEVSDQWANLYPCPNNTNQVFTCGTSGWASSVCDAKLGLYTWVGGNVSLAQNGISSSSSSSSSAVSTSSSPAQSTTATTPLSSADSAASATATANSQQDKHALSLGVGLGVGLGVPLLAISAGFLWLWSRTRRQSVTGQIQQPVLQYAAGAPVTAPAYRLNGGMGELDVPKSSTYRTELDQLGMDHVLGPQSTRGSDPFLSVFDPDRSDLLYITSIPAMSEDRPSKLTYSFWLPPELWMRVAYFLPRMPDQPRWQPWVKYRLLNRIFKKEIEDYYFAYWIIGSEIWVNCVEMYPPDFPEYTRLMVRDFYIFAGFRDPEKRIAVFESQVLNWTDLRNRQQLIGLEKRLHEFDEKGYHPYINFMIERGLTDLLPIDLRFRHTITRSYFTFDWRTYLTTLLDELRRVHEYQEQEMCKSQVRLAIELELKLDDGEILPQDALLELVQAAKTELVGRDGRLLAIRRRRRYRLGLKTGKLRPRPHFLDPINVVERRFAQLDEERVAESLLNMALEVDKGDDHGVEW